MELNYQRCPEDEARVISAKIGVDGEGKTVELGIAEVATAWQIKGCIYAVTLAIKNGVTDDFVAKTAVGLASQMGNDIHALCPVIGILCECFAFMGGGKGTFDTQGLVNIYPAKDCPPLLRGYFDAREQDRDRQDEKKGV